MERRSSSISKKYWLGRKKALEKRVELIKRFLSDLRRELCSSSTIIVFGGRSDPFKLFSTEPRDLDLLIITNELIEHVEEKIKHLKPPKLPLDLIVVSETEFKTNDPLIEKMLRNSYVVCDGLGIFK